MSIIDKFFNGGSARKNVPFGYDKRIVMPKSAQDTIPFYEVYDNGLFLTGVNTFTLIFAFSNIDYSLLRDREQEETYQRYQRLLNALPVEINFQEFIMNSSVNTAKLRNILISNNKINIFDTDINISENGTSAVAMKSELIMSIIETARGLPLSAADKSIIDSCVKEVYADYVLNNGNPEFTPTFVDFYNALINKKLPEADQIALDIELYVNGSFNTFSGKTNIHTDNKLLSIDISDMGEQLRPVGLQVILEYIWQRVRDNRNKGIQTWVWVDEFSVMFNDGNGKETVRSADFFQKVFKRIRKYGGIPTGITQNITEVLDSGQAKVMLSNSEFVVLLQQKKTDLDKLIELFNLSPSQSSYLQTGEKGTGLIVSGRKIIPFDRRVPKDSAIYKLCQTDFRREI